MSGSASAVGLLERSGTIPEVRCTWLEVERLAWLEVRRQAMGGANTPGRVQSIGHQVHSVRGGGLWGGVFLCGVLRGWAFGMFA